MAALAVPGLLSRLAQQKEFLKGQLDLICSDDDCALEKVGTQAQADEMRKSFEQLLESRRRCKAFEMALQTLQQRYVLSASETDFTAELAKLADEAAARLPAVFTKELDDQLKQFDRRAWGVLKPDEPYPDDADEDVVATGTQSLFVNLKCPISMRELASLKEPVVDQRRVVYEKEYVLQHIAVHAKKHPMQPCPCPQAGCSHTIAVSDLKPVNNLADKLKRQARAVQQKTKGTAGAGGSSHGGGIKIKKEKGSRPDDDAISIEDE